MDNTPNKKLIGLFTAAGLALFVCGILILSWNKFSFRNDNMVVFYFDESIKGLSVGSSVVFRGVEIGRVARISLVTDPEKLTFRIPVFVRMNNSQAFETQSGRHPGRTRIMVYKLIEKGLRGRLLTQNILTGQLMIEMELFPDTPVVYRGPREEVGYAIEIPTVLSPFGQLSQGFQEMPIRSILDRLDALLDVAGTSLPATMENINRTMGDIGSAARAMRNFADFLERHPESLLRGKRGGY